MAVVTVFWCKFVKGNYKKKLLRSMCHGIKWPDDHHTLTGPWQGDRVKASHLLLCKCSWLCLNFPSSAFKVQLKVV